MGAGIGIATALGGILGGASSYLQGQAQAKAYSAQAETAERNRRIAENAASEAVQQGAREESRFRKKAGQFAATQESQLAASGATMTGSALAVAQDTAMGIEQDVTALRYNTLKDKHQYDVQAVNFANEAANARAAAKNAKTAGTIGAATSLLGAGLSIYDQSGVKYSNGGFDVSPTIGDWYNRSYDMTGTPTGMSKLNEKWRMTNWWER